MKKAIIMLAALFAFIPTVSGKQISEQLRHDAMLRRARNVLLDYTAREAAYDSLIEEGGKEALLKLGPAKGMLQYHQGRYHESLKTFDQIEEALDGKELGKMLNTRIMKATLLYYSNEFKKAVQEALGTASMETPDSMRWAAADSYRLLAHIFADGSYHAKAREFLELVDQEMKTLGRSGVDRQRFMELECEVLGTKSAVEVKNGNLEEGYRLLRLAIDRETDRGNRLDYMAGLGHLFFTQGDFKEASALYDSILSPASHNPNGLQTLVNYIEIKLKTGHPREAQELFEQYRGNFQYPPQGALMRRLNYLRAHIALNLGDSLNAFIALDSAYRVSDSLATHQSGISAAAALKDFEGLSTEKLLSMARRQNGRQRLYIGITAALLGLCLLGCLLLWRQRRRHGTRNEELRQAIAKNEIEAASALRQTEDALGQRNRELSTLALHMAKINEALNGIERIVNDSEHPEDQDIRAIRSRLRQLKVDENVWHMFKVSFEEVNHEFFDKLTTLYPALTKSELRMCAYTMLNMTSKEIATMTSRSVRTVDTIRYNIRHKMNLTGSLAAWLREISAKPIDQLHRDSTNFA